MSPKQISIKEILRDLKDGLSDREIKSKYELSESQLNSVFKKLVQAGHISQSDLNKRPKESASDQKDFQIAKAAETKNVKISPVQSRPTPAKDAEMSRLRHNTVFGLTIGFLSQIAGLVVASPVVDIAWLGGILLAAGYSLFIWGCYSLALKKGYSSSLALFGILSCFGLVALFVLPDKNTASKTGAAVSLMIVAVGFIVVAVLGIVAAIAIPQYSMREKRKCDSEAGAGVEKVRSAFQKMRNEASASNVAFNDEAIKKIANANALKYLVGPHYKWSGCNKGCGTLIRMVRRDGEWIVEGTALNGTRPSGANSRYVYSASLTNNRRQSTKVVRDISDAKNGLSESWNSYPSGNQDLCYTESIVAKPSAGQSEFELAFPKGVPCRKSADFK